ncbi:MULTISPECIES: hypothetical protein [Pseudomonadaceae]|uniref:hypothetical protein n=1 Tax=Pseudomonadaceae TaxID=135621 RepID=UPI0025532400|nr:MULTISPECIES: hypothetical protein [Pseudomonadaceae]
MANAVQREVEADGTHAEIPGEPGRKSGWWRGFRERLLPSQRPAKNASLWRTYALAVGERLQERLQEDDETVDRLHAFLHARLLEPGGNEASLSIPMRIWPDTNGYVRRAVFDPLGSRRADCQLRRIVMGRPLPAPPPEMPSPIELMITLALKHQGARNPAPSLEP